MKKTIIATGILAFVSTAAMAEEVNVYTAKKGGAYYDTYGVNSVLLLREQGYSANLKTSKGSVDNLGKVAAEPNAIGWTQADVYAKWISEHPEENMNVTMLGKFPTKECIFVVVRQDSGIDEVDDFKKGMKIAVGDAGSGSAESWKNLQSFKKELRDLSTFNAGGIIAQNQVATKQYDAFLYTMSMDKLDNKFLKAIKMPNSNLKLISLNESEFKAKLPDGSEVYTMMDATSKVNNWSDDKVKVPCFDTVVVTNSGSSDDLKDDFATALATNATRLAGTAAK